MALQTVQVSVQPRLSTALKDRSVVPYSSPKVSARLRYVSNSVVFLHRSGTLVKGYRLSKLFSKAEPVLFEKEININLVYSSCLKHADEMLLGDLRQTDQRTQSFHFPIVIHQSLDPAAQSSAQAPSSSSLHALRALVLDRLRTRRREGSTRRRGNHMHDHSRFQSDIDDVTGVSLSLSLSQKSLTHNIGETARTAATRIREHQYHTRSQHPELSGIAAHVINEGHTVHWEPRVVARETNLQKRKLKPAEALFIDKLHNDSV